MSSITNRTFTFSGLDDQETARILSSHDIALTVEEARKLEEEILKRQPTLAELVLFSIEGSEHCSYKSSRMYLKQFVTTGSDVVIGAKEDAGVIRLARDREGHGYCIVLSHESHNHPSQIVPYEGAATGVGGNVRDVCCMGAEVIAIADDLRFGELSNPETKRLYQGVSAGIAGYGNPIGVPNLAGGLQFDPGYRDNCLVTVVTLGSVREDRIIHSFAPPAGAGYDMILVGKPTDNSGFGGAGFASFDLSEDSLELNKGAVQEPNAFLGRHLIKASAELFKKLAALPGDGTDNSPAGRSALSRVGFKDLGAGGIACAGVELADSAGLGAEINLDLVPVGSRESGETGETYPPQVILCAETQERYLWVSPPDLTPLILDHYNREFDLPGVSRGACAAVIGRILAEPVFRVLSKGETIVDAPTPEVTRGFEYTRTVGPDEPAAPHPDYPPPEDLAGILLSLLDHENIASRIPLYETYDKQVQGMTVEEAGTGDSGVLRPFGSTEYPEEIRDIGITLTTDQNPRMNKADPYLGAVHAVAEAYCNTIACGAVAVAFSDCLCYGNPERPNQMRQFVLGCTAVADTARFLGVPIIAGNVSLYNESSTGAIPPSPMIACLGRLENISRRITQGFKRPGSPVYLIGPRDGVRGGSVYHEILGIGGGPVPSPDLDVIRKAGRAMERLAREGLAAACHDISEGGLGVTLSEMAISGGIGFEGARDRVRGIGAEDVKAEGPGVKMTDPARNQVRLDGFLFGEAPGLVLEIFPENEGAFIACCTEEGIKPLLLGSTAAGKYIRIGDVIDLDLEEAANAREHGLRRRLQ